MNLCQFGFFSSNEHDIFKKMLYSYLIPNNFFNLSAFYSVVRIFQGYKAFNLQRRLCCSDAKPPVWLAGQSCGSGWFHPDLDPAFEQTPGQDPNLKKKTKRHTDKHANRKKKKNAICISRILRSWYYPWYIWYTDCP